MEHALRVAPKRRQRPAARQKPCDGAARVGAGVALEAVSSLTLSDLRGNGMGAEVNICSPCGTRLRRKMRRRAWVETSGKVIRSASRTEAHVVAEGATSSVAPYYGRFWPQNQDRDKALAPPPSSPGAFATKDPFFGAFFAAALAFPFGSTTSFGAMTCDKTRQAGATFAVGFANVRASCQDC